MERQKGVALVGRGGLKGVGGWLGWIWELGEEFGEEMADSGEGGGGRLLGLCHWVEF